MNATTEATSDRQRPVWYAILASKEGLIGIILLLFVLLLIIAGPWLAPYPSDQLATARSLSGPSLQHPLGTDQLGRDVFSRFLAGGATVVFIPMVANLLGFILGGTIGLLGVYYGGRIDELLARLFDLMIALPSLLLTLILIAGMGSSWPALIMTIALVTAPRAGRVVRGAAQVVAAQDYVLAARLRGESIWRVMAVEILPNAVAPIVAIFSLYLTYAIIAVSTLSFLGLGAQPPSSDWGLMIADSRQFLVVNPWATLVPAAAIAVLAISFTMLSDAVGREVAGEQGES